MTTNPLDEIYGFSSAPKSHPLDSIYGTSSPAQKQIIGQNFQQKEDTGTLAKIGNAITDPFTSIGAGFQNLVRSGAQAIGLPETIFGQKQTSAPSIFGGTTDVTGYRDGQELSGAETAQQFAGQAAQGLSNFIGAGAVKTIGQSAVAKTLPNLVPLAKQGAIASGLTFGGAAAEEGKTAQEITKETIKGAAIGAVASPVIGAVTAGVPAAARKLFSVKTEQEIMSTPIEKLSTLTSTERNFYFSQKASEISSKYQDEIASIANKNKEELEKINQIYRQTTEKVDIERTATINSVKEEATKLQNELAEASVKEVEALKPRLIETMRKSSDTYRKLVDDEIADVADVQVTNGEIGAFIRNRFDDPEKADQIIKILSQKTEGPQTVGSVYEKTKSLRKEIGSGAKTGTRTLTSEEYNTTEAISQLLDFLKIEKGVDLSRANKFWAEYSPIKNKLYRYIQPYKPTGSETASFKTFAKILTSNDPYNQNFIKETEKLLGVNFKDSKVRDILSKIDENKKRQIAAKITSETKLKEAQIQKLEQTISAKEKLATLKQSAKEMKSLEEAKQELVKLRATQEFEKRTLLKRIIGGFLVIAIGQQATNAVLGGF